jgi:hypothetical protein
VDDSRNRSDHIDGAHRSISKRKRVSPPRPSPARTDTTYTPSSQPDGVTWPTGGFEANQYSPAGEVVVLANLFRGLQRRWRRRGERRAARK